MSKLVIHTAHSFSRRHSQTHSFVADEGLSRLCPRRLILVRVICSPFRLEGFIEITSSGLLSSLYTLVLKQGDALLMVYHSPDLPASNTLIRVTISRMGGCTRKYKYRYSFDFI